MKILDRLARAWLLRKGAEWRREDCQTCRYCADLWLNYGLCFMRRDSFIDYLPACPAWQRKEDA